jgi:2-oxoglutarate ferredoxin oxidoreductase subunit beta
MSVNAPVKLTIKDYKSELHNDWCAGCVLPSTKIITPSGKRSIADIRVGDEVLGHDGQYHRVTETMSHLHPATIHHVTVEGLGTVVLTSDHPIYMARTDATTGAFRFDWVPADEVKVGDEIAYTRAPSSVVTPQSVLTVMAVGAQGRTAVMESAAVFETPYVIARVIANEVRPYDGIVHNLEVADVHSYVTDVATLHNCGDFGILTSIQMALAQLQLDPDKVAVFSGIGCSGKTPHYINAYGFHTLHGRVLTVATGARLANTKQTVLALGGDGDGYGIGAGYFVGAGRRNVDFAYIVHNNNVYGLTKGQASPTLAKGKKTKSMPEQSIQDGINPVAMAIASGYTFIARAYALEPKYTAGIIARAIEHKGAALVDVLQTCPTYNDLYTKEWYEGADLAEKKSRLYKLEDQGFDGKVQDPSDTKDIITKKAAAVARSYEAEPIPIGVYYEIDLPTYEDEVFRRIPDLKETPLVEQNSFERDVNPLLEAMR